MALIEDAFSVQVVGYVIGRNVDMSIRSDRLHLSGGLLSVNQGLCEGRGAFLYSQLSPQDTFKRHPGYL